MTKRKPNPFAHLFGGAALAATVLFNGAAVAQEKPAEVNKALIDFIKGL